LAKYKDIIPFIREVEGGLSRAKSDTASRNPSSCVHNGVKGWHTNKGVTWETFSSNASKLGYNPSCSNFLKMPDRIWEKIYKKSYWDTFDLDNSKSQVVANAIVSWTWGSGNGGAYNSLRKFLNTRYGYNYPSGYSYSRAKELTKALNELAEKHGEKKIFEQLNDWRKAYFISINQPTNLKGWLNRLEKFKAYNEDKIEKVKQFAKKNWLYLALAGVGAVGLIYAITKLSKK
jgi:lysozyme family protein